MPVGGFFGTVPTMYARVPNRERADPADVTVGSTPGDRAGDISTGATRAGSTVTTASGVAITVTGNGGEIVTTGSVAVATVVGAVVGARRRRRPGGRHGPVLRDGPGRDVGPGDVGQGPDIDHDRGEAGPDDPERHRGESPVAVRQPVRRIGGADLEVVGPDRVRCRGVALLHGRRDVPHDLGVPVEHQDHVARLGGEVVVVVDRGRDRVADRRIRDRGDVELDHAARAHDRDAAEREEEESRECRDDLHWFNGCRERDIRIGTTVLSLFSTACRPPVSDDAELRRLHRSEAFSPSGRPASSGLPARRTALQGSRRARENRERARRRDEADRAPGVRQAPDPSAIRWPPS